MTFTVRVDAAEELGFLNSLSRQMPFTIATGINDLMKAGQVEERTHIHRVMTLRRPDFIDRTVKILQFANKQRLVGMIGIDPTRDVLAKFEADGVKRPTSGKALAIPIAVRRTKAGIVTENMRVRALGLTAHRTKSGKVQLKGKMGTFTVKGPQGGVILQRIGRKVKASTLAGEIIAGSVRVAYAFKRSVPIPENLRFTETMTKVAEHWPEFVGKAFDRAVATAR